MKSDLHTYAQTNIQLYNQLLHQSYSTSEMILIRDTYELAISVFSGRYQPSEKSFISHCVGTASILSSLCLPMSVVAAGLIHNIYWCGDFGNGTKGLSGSKRKEVRYIVGNEVEEYVARFATLQWNKQTLTVIRHNLDTLTQFDRYILLIELADKLEIHLDLGTLYFSETRRKTMESIQPIIIDIAERIGFPILANELDRVFKEITLAEIRMELRNSLNYSSVIPPNSCRKRLLFVFRDLLIRRFSWATFHKGNKTNL